MSKDHEKNFPKRLIHGAVSVIFLFLTSINPAVIYAVDDTTVSSEQTAPVASELSIPESVTTPVEPPPEYVFNEQTGAWENGTYSWDPATTQSTPQEDTTYSYNTSTGAWDTDEWLYDASTGSYVPNTLVSNIPPVSDSSTGQADPLAQSFSSDPQPNAVLTNDSEDGSGLEGTQKLLSSQSGSEADHYFSGFYNVTISGSINSTATSGNASVLFNTVAGNAISGDTLTQASLLNMIQSSWSSGSAAPNFFTATIQGGHIGDLMLNPGQISVSNGTPQAQGDLSVVISESASIENDVLLVSQSGDALVENNTIAGNATSGDARALANIMNLINSSISANQSFIGVLNVLGDLEGDVLMPKDITNQLTAAQVPSMTMSIPYDINIDSSYSIDNDISALASSGNAEVASNTIAGSATSGNSQTNVTVFNLTGKQIVTSNALLVFVNVLGEWVGFITNAPTGSNTALLGCCTGNNSQTNSQIYDTASYDIDSNYSIDNDVSVSAISGDASVRNNTIAGNATSGSAFAGVNILNIINSDLSFGGWFGALFINIFGNWHGSFGTDTAYGGYSTNDDNGGSGGGSTDTGTSGGSTTLPSAVVVLARNTNGRFQLVGSNLGGDTELPKSTPATVVKSDTDIVSTSSSGVTNQSGAGFDWIAWIIAAAIVGLLLLIASRRMQGRTA